MNIKEYRKKYPQSNKYSDEELTDYLFNKYAIGISRENFNEKFLGRPWHKDSLLTAANIGKAYPVADLLVNTAYNMFVTLPMQMGAFVGGAATDIGEGLAGEKWDLDKARKAYEDIGTFMAAEPISKGGQQLSQAAFGTLDEGARKAGEWVTDVTDSPAMGATTYGALQVAPWILLGQTIKPKGGRYKWTPEQEVLFSKADFIEGFKEASKNRDLARTLKDQTGVAQSEAKMTQIKDIINKHGWTSAAEIPEGTVIRLPEKVAGKPMLPMVIDKIEEPFHIKFKYEYNRSNEFKAVDAVKEVQKDIQAFDTTTTDMSFYDQLMKKPEYFAKEKGRKGKIVYMTPDEYLAKVEKGFDTTGPFYASPELVGKYAEAMKKGDKFPTLMLEYGKTGEKTSFRQEGIHRATAAKQVGIKKVPVLVVEDIAKAAIKDANLKAIIEKAEQRQRNKIYEDQPLEKDLFEQDVQGMAKDVMAEEMLHKGDKTFTSEAIKTQAEAKGLKYSQQIGANSKIELTVSDDFGHTWSFGELSAAKDFVKEYTGHYAAAEKAYYEAWNRTFNEVPEFAREEIRPKKPTYRKFIDNDTTRQQIDDAVPPKPFESLPPIDIINMELYTKDFARMTKEARIGSYEDVTGKQRPEKTGFSLYIEPLKTALSNIDARTGLPFHQLYLDTQHGMRMEVQRSSHYLNKISKTRNINLEGQERIYDLLEQKNIDVFAENYSTLKRKINADKILQKKFGGLTEREFEAARTHRSVYNEAGPEFGIPMNDMITDYAPRMRAAGMQSWEEAYNSWKIPEFRWAAEEQRSGYLMPHERNIHKVTSNYILRGARRKYLAPSMNKLEKLYEKHARDPKELVRLSQPEAKILEKYIEDMRGWPTGFDTAMKITGNRMVNFINKFPLPKRYENIEYRKTAKKITTLEDKIETIEIWEETGRKPGYFPSTENTVNKLIDLHMSLSYSGAMGYRPIVVIRNLTQSMLSMPIVGPKYWVKGVAKALTPEGMAEAKANGILLDDYLPVGGEVYTAGGAARAVTRNSLWAFRKADSFNRASAYWSMKYKVQDLGIAWVEGLKDIKTIENLNKSVNKFINSADLDFFHRAVIEHEVIPLLKIKDINGLAQRMGKQLAIVTQYNYRRANSPYWMKGKLGRVAGQFGTWPTWYVDYLRALKRGSKTNAAKRIAILTGQGLLLQEIGRRVFGVDIKKWVLYHPIFWSGGVATGALGALKDLATGTEYDKARAKDTLKKAGAVHIPGSNAALDLLKAREEYREEDQLKRGLGFKPTYED